MGKWPSNQRIIDFLRGTWKTSTEVAKYFGFTRDQPGRPVDIIEAKLRFLYRHGKLIRREIPQTENRKGRCRFEYSVKPSDICLESFLKEKTEEERRIEEMKKEWQTFCGKIEYVGLRHVRFKRLDGTKVSLKSSDKMKDYVLDNYFGKETVKVWYKDGSLKWVENT